MTFTDNEWAVMEALWAGGALELGEIEGAMSSLSIAVAGLMTVVVAPIAANLM